MSFWRNWQRMAFVVSLFIKVAGRLFSAMHLSSKSSLRRRHHGTFLKLSRIINHASNIHMQCSSMTAWRGMHGIWSSPRVTACNRTCSQGVKQGVCRTYNEFAVCARSTKLAVNCQFFVSNYNCFIKMNQTILILTWNSQSQRLTEVKGRMILTKLNPRLD